MVDSSEEPTVAIDEAGPPAAGLIAALTTDGAGEPWGAKAVGSLLALPGSFALLARSDETPVGFIMVQVAADESEIVNFVVMEHARRQGIGRMLLEAAVRRARESGANSMFLEVACDNESARRLYKAEGFTQVGIREDYYRRAPDDFTDALILRLDLITTARPCR